MKALKRLMPIVATLLFTAGLLFFSSDLALAKDPFDRITISGGQIENSVEVFEPLLMEFFGISNFPNASIEQPQVEGEGYLVTRYYKENDGSFTAWDSLRFYPNSEEMGGYVYYEGLMNGSSEYDGKWYLASFSGSTRMRQIINATEQPLPPTRTILIQLLYITAALGGLAIIVAFGLFVLRPTLRQSSTE
jgi:hypothetical protein